MGDIRLAEKALESGISLESYLRSMKSGESKAMQESAAASSSSSSLGGPPGAAVAPRPLGGFPQQQQQQQLLLQQTRQTDLQSIWGPQDSMGPPQAAVGLGGVPLEHDVEEEFSFLEDTEFSLGSEAWGRGPPGGPQESAQTRSKAAACAAAAHAAAAHAAAAAPSNPGAASVAAWFTAMLAGPQEGSEGAADRQGGMQKAHVEDSFPDPTRRLQQQQQQQQLQQQAREAAGGFLQDAQGRSAHRQEGPRGPRQQQPQLHAHAAYLMQLQQTPHLPEQQQFQLQQQLAQEQQQQQQRKRLQQQRMQMMYEQQQRLHQQQLLLRQHRGQPLDAAQGREAGRQLLSLIGVVPRNSTEGPEGPPTAAAAAAASGAPSARGAPLQAPREEPVGLMAPRAAADLERQFMQRQCQQQRQQQQQQQQM
ncbi:hypothetical protein, conserved [Eimeria tenella]|uniref:Uncharacterized protein n=1 Tax=Eimeria tenella TaxID=5802 RepID=U6KTV7_EIMTE|nr:hypothetical protein, conserved [Eimeria tenella]CDJ41401.1 hypothetical protein, conserved [Eimeria tenella]|eukprot:XP_013232151.1 hypothetical protein, conserved [Eimeria tenella]